MLKAYDNFIKLAIESLGTSNDFAKLKKKVAKKLGLALPTNADLRELYETMVARKTVSRSALLEKNLFSKKIRTESGVAVVAVLTKAYPCPGRCLYCPDEKNMPKSYLKNEPAVMRAVSAKFDPYIQVQRRIRALELNGHRTDKIELIVMGGTFSYLPKNYQRKFITRCFKACNDYPRSLPCHKNDNLEKEQRKNEKAERRIIGLTLETRPDYINEEELWNFRTLGATRVELGVQSLDDEVLRINKRGHTTQKTIEATKLLKNFGFKISYHMMPGLLGSNYEKDLKTFKNLFSKPIFQPDMLKIYPTVVLRDSQLYAIWKKGDFEPLDDGTFRKFALDIKKRFIPPYVRISRLVRDVPEISILAGPKISNLRQLIAKESQCSCIRCREVGATYSKKEKIILNRIDYTASSGQEIFLEYVSPDKKKLFAILRLRLPGETISLPMAKRTALIRELHTYGKMTALKKKNEKSPQHIGLGKKLLVEAEKIAREEFGAQKIVVISGVGARGYYRKLGYRLQKTYMIKFLK